MKISTRITKTIGVYLLAFILTASSIPNIYANTNSEDLQVQDAVQTSEQSPAEPVAQPAAASTPSNSEQGITENPTVFQLSILAGMCEHIVENIEKGHWNLPHDESQKNLLMQAALESYSVADHFLKSFKEKEPSITLQVLCGIIMRSQLECINDLMLCNPLSEFNLEREIKEAQEKEYTIEDLATVIMSTNTALEKLHVTIQSMELSDTNTNLNGIEKTDILRTNDQVLKQLCMIDTILEEQAQFIDSESLKVPNKSAAKNAIKQVRGIIEQRKYDRSAVTENSIHDLLVLNKYLIKHVNAMIRSCFGTIPELDEESLVTRSKREISAEELNTTYEENQKILVELRQASQLAGLKRYHMLFRTIEPYWTKTLDSGRRILWPFLTGFLITLGLQQSDILPQWFDFKIPGLNMLFYGDRWSPKYEGGVPMQPEKDRVGLISNLYHGCTGFVSNALVLSTAGLVTVYGQGDYKLMRNAMNDMMTRASNFLLGRKDVKNSSDYSHVEPKYTFKDVIGQQEIKDKLSPLIRYFEDPQSIDNRGLHLEKGYLFTGKTRSGKSFMAEALAGEIREAFKRAGKDEKAFRFIVAPAEILRQQGGFQACIAHARRYAPCILFIDEIHLLELQTGKNGALLGEFLNQLSGCMSNDPSAKVFVIAATNKENLLDDALRQSGRLGEEIRFEYPTYANRRAFTANILEKRTVNVHSEAWARAINQFARETEKHTFEDLRRTIEDAFLTAANNGVSVEPEHLSQSFDKKMRHILIKHDHEISRQEQEIVAAQQAGFALATKILTPHISIAKVTTLPIRESAKERSLLSQWSDNTKDNQKEDRIIHGRLFTYGNKDHDALKTAQEQINACICALAGYAAGNTLLGKAKNSTSYLAEKRQEAFDIAKALTLQGINMEGFDDTFKNEFLKRAMAFRNACANKADTVMEQNKEALNAIYTALLKRKTLTGKEIDEILAQYTLSSGDLDESMLTMVDTASLNPAV